MKNSLSNNKNPIYIRIYEEIKSRILCGDILPGTRLQSKRVMSALHGYSVNTIDSAYQQLVSEGYIEARPKSGFFVSDPGPIARSPDFSKEILPRTAFMSDEPHRSADDFRVDFSPNAVDMDAFPLSRLRKIVKECFDKRAGEILCSYDAAGSYDLRTSLCRYLETARGLTCRPDQIVIGAGTDFVLQLIMQIIRSDTPVNAIAMENPLYNKAFQIFSGMGISVRLIPVGKEGLRTDLLRQSDADIVYLTPSHQFPLGVILPIHKRSDILSWASQKENRYIIEDDYDSEFRYVGRPIPPIGEADRNGRVIYLGTFSKSIAPSIRISYLVLPERLLVAFRKNLAFYAATVSSIDQIVLSRFIDSGDFERHISRMRTLYRKKRDVLLGALAQYRHELTIRGTDAGLHLIVTVSNGMTESDLVANAAAKGIRVYGISSYYIDTGDPHLFIRPGTVLLGYAGLSEDQITYGVKQLVEAWNLSSIHDSNAPDT